MHVFSGNTLSPTRFFFHWDCMFTSSRCLPLATDLQDTFLSVQSCIVMHRATIQSCIVMQYIFLQISPSVSSFQEGSVLTSQLKSHCSCHGFCRSPCGDFFSHSSFLDPSCPGSSLHDCFQLSCLSCQDPSFLDSSCLDPSCQVSCKVFFLSVFLRFFLPVVGSF